MLSNETVNNSIGQSVLSKSRGFAFTEEGHRFYTLILEFPDGSRRNWTYDFRTGYWHERSQTDILSVMDYGPQRLVGIEGQPYLFDSRLDWATWNGDVIRREAVTPRLHADLRRATIASFQTEVSLGAGGADTDTLKLEWSDDAKATWKDGMRGGKSLRSRRYRWNRLGQFREGRHFRLVVEATRRVDVLGAYVETHVATD